MISLADIQAARERIRDRIYLTPAPLSATLSRATGNALYLKLENLHDTGSFKERGALNRILTMTDDERSRGVITASAGNHGQAVAYHATRHGIRARICMPEFTPIVKVSAVGNYGGEVILHGSNYDEAVAKAKADRGRGAAHVSSGVQRRRGDRGAGNHRAGIARTDSGSGGSSGSGGRRRIDRRHRVRDPRNAGEACVSSACKRLRCLRCRPP